MVIVWGPRCLAKIAFAPPASKACFWWDACAGSDAHPAAGRLGGNEDRIYVLVPFSSIPLMIPNGIEFWYCLCCSGGTARVYACKLKQPCTDPITEGLRALCRSLWTWFRGRIKSARQTPRLYPCLGPLLFPRVCGTTACGISAGCHWCDGFSEVGCVVPKGTGKKTRWRARACSLRLLRWILNSRLMVPVLVTVVVVAIGIAVAHPVFSNIS